MTRALLISVALLVVGGSASAQVTTVYGAPAPANTGVSSANVDTQNVDTQNCDICEYYPPHAGRPDPHHWAAVGNASGSDEVWHYRQSAKRLGLTIFVGYPVPSVISSEETALMGMKGIYVLRSQVGRASNSQLNPW